MSCINILDDGFVEAQPSLNRRWDTRHFYVTRLFPITPSSLQVPQALAIGAAGAIGYYGSRYIIRNRRLKANGSRNLEIVVSPDSPLKSIINKIQHFKEDHTRPFFLFNGHVETILAAWFRSDPPVRYHRECIIMVTVTKTNVFLRYDFIYRGLPLTP